jgi:hypothetical protein
MIGAKEADGRLIIKQVVSLLSFVLNAVALAPRLRPVVGGLLRKVRFLSVHGLLPDLVKLVITAAHEVVDDWIGVDVAELFAKVFLGERRCPHFAAHKVLMVWIFFLSQMQSFKLLPDG